MGFNIISAAEAASYIKHGYNIGLSGFMFLVQRLIILLYTEQTMRYTSINRLMVDKDFSRVQELFSLMPTTIPICLIATMRSMVIT